MNSNGEFLLVFGFLLSIVLANGAIVEIEDGKIEGGELTSRLGVNFDAFLAIPYAEPPLNYLRFQPPVPVKPWDGVFNAKSYGLFCMQKSMGSPGNPTSEDCLQLNVFTKNLGNSQLKPTMVFIHGGAWEIGSGVDSNPVMMMDRDVVFVTINYRLGAFGFLSTGTTDAFGNMALKDQTLALKWVKKNIEKFGGDSNKITIAGFSAGAHSVTAQIVSPMARDLFQGAISMSGGITWKSKLPTDYLKTAQKLAKKLDCGIDDVTEMVECLRKKPATDIVTVEMNDVPECPILTWLPVVEPNLGQERFFTEQPIDSIFKGDFTKVPVIIGVTADEWISPVPDVLKNTLLLESFNKEFDKIAPICFSYEQDTELSKALSEKFRKLYFPFDDIDSRSFSGLNNFFSDGIIGYGVHNFVHLISNFTDVYYYKFSFIGRNGFFRYPGNKPYGVHHGDDGMYLLPYPFLGPMIQPNDPENFMVERMTRIFSQFAETGNPNNKTDEYLSEMNWPKHSQETEYYLDIGTHFVEKNGLFLERYSVWDEVQSSGNHLTHYKMLVLVLISLSLLFK